MIKRLVVLTALLLVSLVQTACSGSALPAGQANANDGWPLALFVLLLMLALLAWWLLSGPEKEATPVTPAHDAHGGHGGHGHEDDHGHAYAVKEEPQVGETELAAHQEIVKLQDAETAAAVPMVIGAPDDLKIVEGIGPKIAGLLTAAGITTFAQLAAADVAQLRQLLADAGLSRLADPATWPEQARLAAVGNWDGLMALQESLKGGRRN